MTATVLPSVCTLDCPDTCSLSVTVENGRIVKVRGSDALPFTGGVVCNKVAHHTVDWVHGKRRVMHPMIRTGARGSGQFRRASWAEALDRVQARVGEVIAKHGPQAVMPLNYAGPHGMLSGDSMSLRFFHKLGATQLYRGAMCGAVRREAWVGTMGAVPGIGPEAAERAALNVVWGNNATATNVHLVRAIAASRKAGGKLAVVDPLRTKIAELADLHLAPRPGTDVLLGFALAVELEALGAHDAAFIREHVLGADEFMAVARQWPVERAAAECGVRADDIRTLARWMAGARPLVIAPGNGLERGRNGGSGVRAIIALPALLGRMDASNGIALGAGNAFPRTGAKLTRPDLLPPGTRTLNILDAGKVLADDPLETPVRAVFIYNHNPVVVHPDQNRMKRGLAREEIFTCGIEMTMTESMAYCDVVLPAASAYECDDLYAAYGQHWLQRATPVVPAQGESLPNTEIFRRLAAAFGFDDPCFAEDDAALMDAALDMSHPRMAGARADGAGSPPTASRLPIGHPVRMVGDDGQPLALMANVRPATPSGRIELASRTLADRWGAGQRLPGYRTDASAAAGTLSLISPASDARISSTLLGEGDGLSEAPPLLMHPDDAGARGLAGAARVRVFNALGEVILPLRVTDDVPPGVVSSEKGAWLSTSPTGQTISALVSADARADLADGACFNDTRVSVAAA